VDSAQITFGTLLKRFRQAAGLSQEALAERARMSARGVSDLERGVHRAPYRETLRQLMDALDLNEEQRAALEAASHRTPRPYGQPVRQPSPPHNLSEESTSFVGRVDEISMLQELLHRPDARLITLTGPGGCGKTRLALRTAASSLGGFADGVFFVPLATLADPDLVLTSMAATLGVREREGRRFADTLKEYLRDKTILLVLDNFEHLLDAAGGLSGLLEECPGLRLLVTSQTILKLSWEYVFTLQPLAVPAPPHDSGTQEISHYEGVALFVQRARAASSAFQVTNDNVAAVAEICYRLDGLPLAIELAAARIRLFPPQALLGRLSSRLKLLVGGARDQPTRQQTLRAAIDWSYSLLDETEQNLLARLAVFAGGCTIEAAEVVCEVSRGDQIDVLTGVASLVDKSLLWRGGDISQPEPRLRMLATIREYALERLAAIGAGDEVGRQHACYFLELAERFAAEPDGQRKSDWLHRLSEDHDNLQAALRWTIERRETQIGFRMAIALSSFWELRGYLTEGRRSLAGLLAIASDEVPELRAAALKIAGSRAFEPDFVRAAALTEQSLAQYRSLTDTRGVAEALDQRGVIAFYQADYERAEECLQECLVLARGLEDADLVSRSLWSLAGPNPVRADIGETKQWAEELLQQRLRHGDSGDLDAILEVLLGAARIEGDQGRMRVLLEQTIDWLRHAHPSLDAQMRERLARMAFEMTALGAYGQADALLEEAIALDLRKGHRRDAARLGLTLAQFAREQGRMAEAISLLEQGLAVFREFEDVQGVAGSLIGLADVARDRGDVESGIGYSGECLTLARELGDTLLKGYALHNLGAASWQQGDYVQADSLFDASLASLGQIVEGRAEVLASMGLMALEREDIARARKAFTESLDAQQGGGLHWLTAMDLEGLAGVAAADGRPDRAARFFGAAHAIRMASGIPIQPTLAVPHERRVTAVRQTLGGQAYATAFAQGRAMTLDQVIAEALDDPAIDESRDDAERRWRGFRGW
jgi:predicted ATPase/Tfp pilus assembly protein PilF/DNA-binding XRE family transcriptional regulator